MYQRFYSPLDGSKISATSLYTFVGALAVTWIITFAIFLRQIKPHYKDTFFTFKTGFQFTIDSFKNGNDLQKSDVFNMQKRHWTSIRGEVKEWTLSNWSQWESEKPDWFTEFFISTVPSDFIPRKLDPDRRRSSVLGSLLNQASSAEEGKKGVDARSRATRRQSLSVRVTQAPEENV